MDHNDTKVYREYIMISKRITCTHGNTACRLTPNGQQSGHSLYVPCPQERKGIEPMKVNLQLRKAP